MYQKYSNAGGMKTPFDLTDNTETIKKINKVYEQMNSKKMELLLRMSQRILLK